MLILLDDFKFLAQLRRVLQSAVANGAHICAGLIPTDADTWLSAIRWSYYNVGMFHQFSIGHLLKLSKKHSIDFAQLLFFSAHSSILRILGFAARTVIAGRLLHKPSGKMRPLALLIAALVLTSPAAADTCRRIVVRDTGTGKLVRVKVCGGPGLARGRL